MDKILRVGELKNVLKTVNDNMYIAVGTKENNESKEILNESGIIGAMIKPIGFSDSNEKYLKLYIKKYEETGCMRFVR